MQVDSNVMDFIIHDTTATHSQNRTEKPAKVLPIHTHK
jgi:hypothetical protein